MPPSREAHGPRPTRSSRLLLGCAVLHGLGLYVLALRWFPITATFHPSDLGIVSVATLARYPAQQEIWYAAAAVVGPLAYGLVVLLGLRRWAARVAGEQAAAGGAGGLAAGDADGLAASGAGERTAGGAGGLSAALAAGARVAPVMGLPLAWVLFVAWPGKVAALGIFGGTLAFVIYSTGKAREVGGASPRARARAWLAGDLARVVFAGAGAVLGAVASLAHAPGVGRSSGRWAIAGAVAGAVAEGVARRAGRDTRAGVRWVAPLAFLALVPYAMPLGTAWGLGIAGAAVALGSVAARVLPERALGWMVALAVAGAVALDPSTVQRVTRSFPDVDVVDARYAPLAEHGQRLEWVTRWMSGELPGRDFLYLYGPLMLEAVRGVWAVCGRSGAALLLAFHLQDLLGILCVLVCARTLLRTRTFGCVALLGTVPLYLRSGVAGLSLALLVSESPAAWFGAGAALGFSCLYSQEFAVALAAGGFVMAVAFRDGRALRRLAISGAGAVVVAGPYVAHLAWTGALRPLVDTMVTYPRLMFAGYSKVPYPSLSGMLPLVWRPEVYLPGWSNFGRVLSGFYLIPAFYLAGAVYVLARRVAGVRAVRRERLVAGLTVFGLVSFRAALGHSCLGHQEAVVWPAVLIAALLCEEIALTSRPLAGVLALALVPLAFTIKPAWYRFDEAWSGWEAGRIHGSTGLLYEWVENGPPRAGELKAVVQAIRATTPEGAPIVALPNGSAYHYYAGRPNPTQYCSFGLLITEEHRRDAVRAMEARPPACVVYDVLTPRLDELPDRLNLAPLLTWVTTRYEVRQVIGGTLLCYPRLSGGQARPAVSFGDPAELAARLAGPVPLPAPPFVLEFRP